MSSSIKNQHRINSSDQEDRVKFTPWLWEQRRAKIYKYLQFMENKVIMDLGCGEGNVLKFLIPSNDEVECSKLIGVDCNLENLKKCFLYCEPSFRDIEFLRPRPLNIELYLGSCDHYDPNLPKVDVIVFSEVVEHLIAEELEEVHKVIFGGYRPKYVIISTPNSEFNILFKNLNYGQVNQKFRDEDHKFEWTRAEFAQWCDVICKVYGYNYERDGVGVTHDSIEYDLGYCSQFAIFKLKPDFNNYYPKPNIRSYIKHASIDYPYYEKKHSAQEAYEILLETIEYVPTHDGRYLIEKVWNNLKIKQAFKSKSSFIKYLSECPTIVFDEPTLYFINQESINEFSHPPLGEPILRKRLRR